MSGISNLIQGYHRFKAKHYEQSAAYQDLVANGQKPKILIIACSDSRVDPTIITDSQPGDIFVVRNVANLVPPLESNLPHSSVSSALEFAIGALKVTDVIVLGHSGCGGIRALMSSSDDDNATDLITPWVKVATPAKQIVVDQHPNASLDEQCHHCEHASLKVSLQNLMTFPCVKNGVDSNTLKLHAWYFDMKTASVKTYQADTDTFADLT